MEITATQRLLAAPLLIHFTLATNAHFFEQHLYNVFEEKNDKKRRYLLFTHKSGENAAK